MAMGWADELDTKGKETGTAVDVTLDFFGFCEILEFGGRIDASILSFAASIIFCGIV